MSKSRPSREREACCPAPGQSELCVCRLQGAGSDAKRSTDMEGGGPSLRGQGSRKREENLYSSVPGPVLGASPPSLWLLSREGKQMEKQRLGEAVP